MTKVDIVVLSLADTIGHYRMTQACVDSIVKALGNDIQARIVVYESAIGMPVRANEAPFKAQSGLVSVDEHGNFIWRGTMYTMPDMANRSIWVDDLAANSDMIVAGRSVRKPIASMKYLPDGGPIAYNNAETKQVSLPFNYSKTCNLAWQDMQSDWLLVLNNDTIMHPGAIEAMIASGYKSISPISPGYDRQAEILDTTLGYIIGTHIAGWAIMTHKSVLDLINGYDENYDFYHTDVAYAMKLINNKIDHAVVPTAMVTHLLSQTAPGYNHKQMLFQSTHRFYSQYPDEWFLNRTGHHSAYWSWQELFPDKAEPSHDTLLPFTTKKPSLEDPKALPGPIKRRPGRPKKS